MKRGVDGRPVAKNSRHDSEKSILIGSLLNPVLVGTSIKKKEKIGRKKRSSAKKSGKKTGSRRLTVDCTDKFDDIRALTSAPSGMKFG